MKKTIPISKITGQIILIFVAALIMTSFISISKNHFEVQTENTTTKRKPSFTFTPITELQFKDALKNNFNAPFVTDISDTASLERAFASIDKTYDENEKELAKHELCKSSRCLTSFKAYYPTLGLYLFEILDYHYAKACFINSQTDQLLFGYKRFRGTFGVMSKDGLFIGLERNDADNYLQIEICKTSQDGAWPILKFDFTYTDIDENADNPIFWAAKNTIYLASKEYDKEGNQLSLFYEIKFDY